MTEVLPPEPPPSANGFSHTQEELLKHETLCNKFIEATRELIKLDKTSRLIRLHTNVEKPPPGVGSDDVDNSPFLAKLRRDSSLSQAVDMGFGEAYFIPDTVCVTSRLPEVLPEKKPDGWFLLTADIAPSGFTDDQYLLRFKGNMGCPFGSSGTLFARSNTANEVLLRFLYYLRDNPTLFPLTPALNLFTIKEEDVKITTGLSYDYLSTEQNYCLNFVASNDLTFIWGPPGTGKSTTLCALIDYCLNLDMKVFVASHTNKAIDSVAEKLWDISQGSKSRAITTAVENNLITRYGKPTTPKRIKTIAYAVRMQNESVSSTPVLTPSASIMRDKVTISTLFRYLSLGDTPAFDAVFIDEVGAVAIPFVYCVGCVARKKIIASGDPAQLPPIFGYNGPISQATRTIFTSEIYGINKMRLTGDEPDKRLTPFSIQHRMPDALAHLVRLSNLYRRYETSPARKCSPTEKKARAVHPLPGSEFAVIDTSVLSPKFGDKTNPIHEALGKLFIEHCIEMTPGGYVGVVSPYRNQAMQYGKWLNEQKINKVIAGTAHAFQGSECPIILWDTVESPPMLHGKNPTHRFTDDVKYKGDTTNLINVSVSRSQGKFVVLANLDHLREHLDQDAYLSRILGYAAEMNCIVPAQLFLRSLGKELGADSTGPPNFTRDPFIVKCPQLNDFFGQLGADARAARNMLQIRSKKTSKESVMPTLQWMDKLCKDRHITAEIYISGRLNKDVQTAVDSFLDGRPHINKQSISNWPHSRQSFVVFDTTLSYEVKEDEESPDLFDGEAPERFFRYIRN